MRRGERFWRHSWIRHLRLPFNLLLSPIYLWGVLLAGGSLRTLDFWLGYAALHLFLYGGATAFNSFYDRDEGPVGGMLEPPPVDRDLLGFSLVVQLLGLLLALWVNPAFVLAWLVIFVIATAYSHPLTRLKANSWAALAAVAWGQGVLGFAAGWLVARPLFASLLSPPALFGMFTTASIVTGLYLVTQSYQTAADRARGDRTLAVLWGPRRALNVALALLVLGGGVMVAGVGPRFGWLWAGLLSAFFTFVALFLWRWAGRFDEAAVEVNFALAMRLSVLSSAALSLFLLLHLL
jgi:1,4-dihydroxy-2-naphthoate octaprenyltransferase